MSWWSYCNRERLPSQVENDALTDNVFQRFIIIVKKVWRAALIFTIFFAFVIFPVKVFANGTINAKILGPHGEAAASTSYTFSQTGSTSISGTTDSTGAISQSLSAGT